MESPMREIAMRKLAILVMLLMAAPVAAELVKGPDGRLRYQPNPLIDQPSRIPPPSFNEIQPAPNLMQDMYRDWYQRDMVRATRDRH